MLLSLIRMVQAFRDSIRTGQAPEMSGAEGLRDLAVVLKAYESMAQGVSLPLPREPLGACGPV